MILIFVLACAVTFLVTPTVRFFALKFSIIDQKGQRKSHTKVITHLGGLGIYIGFMFAVFSGILLLVEVDHSVLSQYWVILILCTLMLFLGMYDDIQGVSPIVKLSVEVLGAACLIKAGFVVKILSFPIGEAIDLGIWSVPFTVLWIVGVTNAINLIDGLDGLADGIVLISSMGLFFIFLFTEEIGAALLVICLAGACLGFLKYNFPPAKMFMGDTGTLFLGFTIAALSITTRQKATTATVFLVPLIGLAIPIVDTSWAFLRRILTGKHPFLADNKHIHHILLRKNLSKKQVVFLLWGVTAILNILAYVMLTSR